MQGHIRKRSKHSWTLVINLGRDPATGKRKQIWRAVTGTKRDAEAALARLIADRDSGLDVDPGKLTVAQFLKRWLRDYAAVNTAPATHRRYEQIVRIHLVPALGAITLRKLRPQHIQAAYAGVRAKGRSEQTVLHCHRVLRESLKHAMKWQILARNPADAVDAPRAVSREVITPDATALTTLLTEAELTPLGAMIYTALMTGLRLGELSGLRWQDVDLDRGDLHVRRSAQWTPGAGMTYAAPKTTGSARSVALSRKTVNRLRRHRHDQLEARLVLGPAYSDDDLVFATAIGTPYNPSNVRRIWLTINRQAGLKMRFHDLRHAHATLMLQQGTHPKIVSERLGHSTIAITLDTYSHVLPSLQREAADKLDRLFAVPRAQ